MVLQVVKRHQETFAWVLVGFVAASVFVEFIALFIDPGFVRNAAGRHLAFVSPVFTAALALAVWLVGSGERATPRARTVVTSAMALVGAMLLLGLVAWLTGLTLESFLQSGAFKLMNSLRFVVDAGLLVAVGWFGWMVLGALPAATPAPRTPRPRPERAPAQPWTPFAWDEPQDPVAPASPAPSGAPATGSSPRPSTGPATAPYADSTGPEDTEVMPGQFPTDARADESRETSTQQQHGPSEVPRNGQI